VFWLIREPVCQDQLVFAAIWRFFDGVRLKGDSAACSEPVEEVSANVLAPIHYHVEELVPLNAVKHAFGGIAVAAANYDVGEAPAAMTRDGNVMVGREIGVSKLSPAIWTSPVFQGLVHFAEKIVKCVVQVSVVLLRSLDLAIKNVLNAFA